jgi:hypothetical protein
VLARRSQTRGDEVREATKNGLRFRVTLPGEVTAVLRWHVERLPRGPMQESDLLFPSEAGGFRSPTVLDKPFKDVCKHLSSGKSRSAASAATSPTEAKQRSWRVQPYEDLGLLPFIALVPRNSTNSPKPSRTSRRARSQWAETQSESESCFSRQAGSESRSRSIRTI